MTEVRPVYRRIGEYKVLNFGNLTPDQDLKALIHLADYTSMIAGKPPVFVEIGSWVGESAIALYYGAPQATIHCIDTWQGSESDGTGPFIQSIQDGRSIQELWHHNTQSVDPHAFIPHTGKSTDVAMTWNTKANLIFIDAEHTYDAVKADIAAWFPHLHRKGVLCGHDYGQNFPGVAKAVNEFAESIGKRVWNPTNTTIWAMQPFSYAN